jgi:peptide-methionine (R)-S-oxide reductase
MHSRRNLLQLLLAGSAGVAFGATPSLAATFEVTHTDAEWRKLLSPSEYNILRRQGTEVPFTSPLLNEHRKGTFLCRGCALPLFASSTKYDSGTGWPSFWQPLPHAIETSSDSAWIEFRTEVHCRRCGGHLGHVFDDGPKPTGLRYCMDGLALTFKPG